MQEKRPFTPHDFRIGRAGGNIKGPSDYPSPGTQPRDGLKVVRLKGGREKRTIKMAAGILTPLEADKLAPSPEEEYLLAEAEGERKEKYGDDNDSEGIEIEEGTNEDDTSSYTPDAGDEGTGNKGATYYSGTGIGVGRERGTIPWSVQDWGTSDKKRGKARKPKGRKAPRGGMRTF